MSFKLNLRKYIMHHMIPNLTWLSFCWRLMLSQAKNITTNIEKQCLQKNKLRLIVTKRLHNKIVLEICLGLKTFQTRCKYLKGKLCEMMGPWRKNCLHNQGYSFETQYPNFVPIQYSSKYMVWTSLYRTFFRQNASTWMKNYVTSCFSKELISSIFKDILSKCIIQM